MGDLLNIKHRQPSASLADLCTVMMMRSPHGSLNWAKIPCDYPMFRAGVLCKRPLPRNEGSVEIKFYIHRLLSSDLILIDNFLTLCNVCLM